jgi:transcriptional regulator with XRE-family HTH domain
VTVLESRQIETVVEFAEALTALRQAAGMSIRELSRRTDIPSATLGGYFSGRHLPTANQAQVLLDVLMAMGVDDPDVHADWVEALMRVRRESTVRRDHEAAPYLGLQSFGETEAEHFFGRGRVVDELRALLDQQWERPEGQALLLLIGASGSGKTSLLRAGLIPSLRDGQTPRTVVATMVPGSAPQVALTVALSELDVSKHHPGQHDPGERRVLVVDQFEEVFAPTIDATDRSAFLERLVDLAAPEPSGGAARVQVLIAVRADFFGATSSEPLLLPALQTSQYLLGPMTAAELEEAIRRPAESVGVTVEPALVDLVLASLRPRSGSGAHEPGALPLMSHALLSTWRHRQRGPLTAADYVAVGGLRGAVQQTAEACYTELDAHERDVARWLFGLLIHVADDWFVTRRRRPLRDFTGPHAPFDNRARTVIETFVGRRLLTVTDTTVEFSHEALLDAWPRLRQWVQEDSDRLLLHQRISDATHTWIGDGRDPADLMRGAPLAAAAAALDSTTPGALRLTADESDFVASSLAEQHRIEVTERQRSRRLRSLLVLTSSLAVVAGVAAVEAMRRPLRRERP